MGVTICDVGPRDGLQNEPETLPPATRAELVNRLAAANLPRIEAARGGRIRILLVRTGPCCGKTLGEMGYDVRERFIGPRLPRHTSAKIHCPSDNT